MTLVLSVLEQGMIYAVMALGIYITYKILDFPDLTVDGSFPLGAALTCALITAGCNPFLTILVSFVAGAVVGILTGLIHVKLKVRDLLSGIIMMTALYTVNLQIAGRANLPIYNFDTIFDNRVINAIFPESMGRYRTVIIILIIIVIFAPKLFSIEPMVVVSGSMEPSYMKGSLLYVKESAGGIQTGDVITFYRNGELVTHRVVEINTDEKTYITKGDANQVNDVQPVAWSDVVGVPVFDIPVLGYPASFLGTAQGKLVFIVLLIIFTGITVLTDKKMEKTNG